MKAKNSLSAETNNKRSQIHQNFNTKRFYIGILLCLIITNPAISELKKCNRDLLKYFNLKGNPVPVETKMLICPGITDNCCNVTDELNIFTLWHNYTIPKMNRHVDDLLILYKKILKKHKRILSLDTDKIQISQSEDDFVMYPLKICERSLAAIMPSGKKGRSLAGQLPDNQQTKSQNTENKLKNRDNFEPVHRVLNIDSDPEKSFEDSFSKEIHRSESKKIQHKAQRMLSMVDMDAEDDEIGNLKTMMGGMSGSLSGGDASLDRLKMGFKSDFAKNLSIKNDHDLDKYRGKSPEELQAKLNMLMMGSGSTGMNDLSSSLGKLLIYFSFYLILN